MSATVHSEVVDLDNLIPRVVDIDRENKDVNRLIPYVFKHAQFAEEDCTMDWPKEDSRFSDFFYYLDSCRSELYGSGTGLLDSLEAIKAITLPRQNWRVPERESHSHFISAQGMILRILMKTVYENIEGLAGQCPKLHFPVLGHRQKYVINGKRYAAKPEGAITVSQQDKLPVISYPGWFEGQEWDGFLGEVLSVMLGQLTKNISTNFQNQEVFVVGFHGLFLYIARGLFTTDLISKVQLKGCSESDLFKLTFSRGYNMCLREDWLEAMRALTRLLRYLLSGKANISAIRTCSQRQERSTE